jgi:hypothetical protein
MNFIFASVQIFILICLAVLAFPMKYWIAYLMGTKFLEERMFTMGMILMLFWSCEVLISAYLFL